MPSQLRMIFQLLLKAFDDELLALRTDDLDVEAAAHFQEALRGAGVGLSNTAPYTDVRALDHEEQVCWGLSNTV